MFGKFLRVIFCRVLLMFGTIVGVDLPFVGTMSTSDKLFDGFLILFCLLVSIVLNWYLDWAMRLSKEK